MSSGVEEPQFQLGMVSELEADSDMLSLGEVRVEIPDFGGHVMFLFWRNCLIGTYPDFAFITDYSSSKSIVYCV